MAYPPANQPINKTNASPQLDDHPAAHNALAQAINDLVAELGTNPSLSSADVTTLLRKIDDRWSPNQIEGVDHWTTGSGLEIQADTSVVMTNAGAAGSVVFPKVFSRNPIVVAATADVSTPYFLVVNFAARATNGFAFTAWTPWTGAGASNVNVRVNWVAMAGRNIP